MPKLRASKRRFGSVPLLFIISILCVGQAPVPEPVIDQETELGQEMYKDMRNKEEIFESSHLFRHEKDLGFSSWSNKSKPRNNDSQRAPVRSSLHAAQSSQ
jgi:hypothetical protein